MRRIVLTYIFLSVIGIWGAMAQNTLNPMNNRDRIFTVLLVAILMGFTPQEAASLGIIGGADGPTAIFTTIKLAPHLLGPIAIAAYSYMALVPVIIPLVVKLFCTKKELSINMKEQEKKYPSELGKSYLKDRIYYDDKLLKCDFDGGSNPRIYHLGDYDELI